MPSKKTHEMARRHAAEKKVKKHKIEFPRAIANPLPV
jgi:hypothetical protein